MSKYVQVELKDAEVIAIGTLRNKTGTETKVIQVLVRQSKNGLADLILIKGEMGIVDADPVGKKFDFEVGVFNGKNDLLYSLLSVRTKTGIKSVKMS